MRKSLALLYDNLATPSLPAIYLEMFLLKELLQ